MSVNLSKEERIEKINLRKEKIVSLTKENNELSNLKARVGLVLDFSGSMHSLYKNGTVQNVIERILPLAMKFDDNQEMELWIFSDGYHSLGTINLDNFHGITKKIMSKYTMGGTEYSPVMNNVIECYSDGTKNLPSYVLFITDGENADQEQAEKSIIGASKLPIFWQFVGIGNEKFRFLEKLDDIGGRYVDSTDFFSIKNIDTVSDDELYKKLLNEFPTWLKNEKVKEIIANGGEKYSQDKKGFFARLFKR